MVNRCEECGGRTDRPGLFGCDDLPHPEPDLSQAIAALIERDIRDRRGLREEFEAIDDETQCDIRDDWAELIRQVI